MATVSQNYHKVLQTEQSLHQPTSHGLQTTKRLSRQVLYLLRLYSDDIRLRELIITHTIQLLRIVTILVTSNNLSHYTDIVLVY